MQYRAPQQSLTQADLFHNALMASGFPARRETRPVPNLPSAHNTSDSGYSEMALSGQPQQCLQWLAPVLRDLANTPGDRWLTLLNPPQLVSHAWLRATGLDPQRILIVRSNGRMQGNQLCQELLSLGCSHTVISWLSTDAAVSAQLEKAARQGQCKSLNIRMP
ncbi:SulA-like leucine-rich domain-containing protein [Halopseudomonas salegens]|uniref:SOS cell division inhibitor SulA n=1 Tax=Halopseudomonas salegens TaxID=1434072 RepID=A0A1H2EWL7_9GAMM|nr:SulA-like leucine-rich domain-containing protein [Halopseudomonas salegens]SDT99536.1 SOS cell division inhibitor SulA [Halopseudomonas salegens]